MKRFKTYLTESTKFKIPPELEDNYKIKGDLSNVDKWKAKTILGNSAGKKGKWDDVGYIMFSTKDNTIIPIARGDEHHTGYDLLFHLQNKIGINAQDFYHIFTIGNNYVRMDNPKIVKQFLNVLKKFKNMGGGDITINDHNRGYKGSVDDFLKRK